MAHQAHRIALFANRDSAQLAEIATAVRDAGAVPVVLDVQAGGPNRNTVTFSPDRFVWAGQDLSDVRAIHIRCTAPRVLPTSPPVLTAARHAELRGRFLEEQAYNAATAAFFDLMAEGGRLVVNRLTSAYLDHDSKSQLYEKLRAWGFAVPDSLTTSDPAAAAAFLSRHDEVVAKPAVGIGSTRLVTEEDRQRLDELRVVPALLQQRIKGPTVRIHVVGRTMVLALRILAEDFVDSRTAPRDFVFCDLDDEERRRIVDATNRLGLHYAAWDAILGPDGRLVYLDCNPGPFVMWIGQRNRSAVFSELASFLLGFAETGTVEEAAGRVRPIPRARVEEAS